MNTELLLTLARHSVFTYKNCKYIFLTKSKSNYQQHVFAYRVILKRVKLTLTL